MYNQYGKKVLLYNVTKQILPLNCTNIIFSITITNEQVNQSTSFYIHSTSKWCIWKHRNNVKYGNHNTKNCDDIFSDIIHCLQQQICATLQNKKIILKEDIVSSLNMIKNLT